VKANSFYGNSQKKDKNPIFHPFTGISASDNLYDKRDSSTIDVKREMGFGQFGGGKQPRVKERMKGKKGS
jgi:hypothetical protein